MWSDMEKSPKVNCYFLFESSGSFHLYLIGAGVVGVVWGLRLGKRALGPWEAHWGPAWRATTAQFLCLVFVAYFIARFLEDPEFLCGTFWGNAARLVMPVSVGGLMIGVPVTAAVAVKRLRSGEDKPPMTR